MKFLVKSRVFYTDRWAYEDIIEATTAGAAAEKACEIHYGGKSENFVYNFEIRVATKILAQRKIQEIEKKIDKLQVELRKLKFKI